MLDTIATPTASPTATVCEGLALFGGSPERGELDSREVWDEDDATEALAEAIRVIVAGVTVEGTQLADEREALLWGFVNMLHSPGPAASTGLVDKHRPRRCATWNANRTAPRSPPWELQQITERGAQLSATAATPSRCCATSRPTPIAVETGETWRPRYGSHISQTGAA